MKLRFETDAVRAQFAAQYDVIGRDLNHIACCIPKANPVTVDEKGIEVHEVITPGAAQLIINEMEQAAAQIKAKVDAELASTSTKSLLEIALEMQNNINDLKNGTG